jgi:hypothetical protein
MGIRRDVMPRFLTAMFAWATGAGVMLIMVVPGKGGVPPWEGARAANDPAEAMLTGTRDRFAAGHAWLSRRMHP